MRRIVFLLPLMLCACAIRSGRQISEADIQKIEKGKTTKQEIIQLFGQPFTTSQGTSGETWAYQFTDAGYDTPIGVVGNETRQQMLSISFQGEIVRDYTWSNSNIHGSKHPLGI